MLLTIREFFWLIKEFELKDPPLGGGSFTCCGSLVGRKIPSKLGWTTFFSLEIRMSIF